MKIFSFLKSEIGRIITALLFFVSGIVFEILSFPVLSLILYVIALLISGCSVFRDAVVGILRRDLLDEKFLMTIASVGAFIVAEAKEGVAVMLFFLIGEYFEHKSVEKSRRSIKSLMDICPDEAVVIVDGVEETVDAEEVEVGSVILIRAGERVPLDCVVLEGSADIDASSLTGESLPFSATVGTRLDSGVLVLGGVIKAKTVATAENSAATRILQLVENANERKSKAENFITVFSHYYTPIIVALAALMAIIPPIFHITSFGVSIYRALIFLVISCPCALVISVPMAFFCGIGRAASEGILYKGGNTFSMLAKADTFAFDKTGTLTDGNFSVTAYPSNEINSQQLLSFAASAEYASNHPIALAIKREVKGVSVPELAEEIAGKGVRAIISGSEVLVGNKMLMEDFSVSLSEKDNPKNTGVYVAKDRRFIGKIKISDNVRADAAKMISDIKRLGVKRTVILSGDRNEKAEETSLKIGVDEVAGELLPNEKFEKLEELIRESKATAYVGDGINDSPSIARADVGIAMGGIGSDAAIEAADIVIVSDDLSRIPKAIKIARKTVAIATANIILALGVKFAVLVLGAIGIANMWLAVFADVGVAVLAILNSMRALNTK